MGPLIRVLATSGSSTLRLFYKINIAEPPCTPLQGVTTTGMLPPLLRQLPAILSLRVLCLTLTGVRFRRQGLPLLGLGLLGWAAPTSIPSGGECLQLFLIPSIWCMLIISLYILLCRLPRETIGNSCRPIRAVSMALSVRATGPLGEQTVLIP